MSTEAVKQVISRAITEPEFKELLFSNPAEALKGYELSQEERAALQSLSREEFDALDGGLEERISRLGIWPIQMTAKCVTSPTDCPTIYCSAKCPF